MFDATQHIGQKIRAFRKKKQVTLQWLAEAIGKSKATVSKYETGQIAIDVATLYAIAKVLDVYIEELLHHTKLNKQINGSCLVPRFFRYVNQFFVYSFDGRNNSLSRCVVDIAGKDDAGYKVMMYMNIENHEEYQICENTYTGYMNHYDGITNLSFQNRDTLMEQYTINILASYLDAPTKWALVCGISSRPLMPVATKALISKKILPETAELYKMLRISKEDIRLLKHYNMLSVT